MLAVAVAVIGLAFMPLQAEQLKCGAGKCGGATKVKAANCSCEDCDNPKCAHKLDPSKPCDCDHGKGDGKGTMKCGGAMKCGAGKCGK